MSTSIRLALLSAALLLPAYGPAALAQDWSQFAGDAARTSHRKTDVAPPYRARWIWFAQERTLRNEKSGEGEKWNADLQGREGHNYPMPQAVPASFAGSMQPVVVGGKVYVADAQSSRYILDADEGTLLKTFSGEGGFWWAPAGTDEYVAFVSVRGVVYGHRLSDGEEVWQRDLGRAVSSAPAAADGRIYINSHDGHVYALDAATGEIAWRSEHLGAPIVGGLCVANGKVYTGSETLQAVALDAKTGKTLATSKRLTGQSFRMTWPVAVGNRVVFTTVAQICPGSEYVNDPHLAGTPDAAVGYQPDLKSGYPDIPAEQAGIRKWLAGPGKDWEVHFALDAETLEQDYVIATGNTEGCGMPAEPPAVGPDGKPLIWWATGHPTMIKSNSFGTNFSTDLNPFDLATGGRIPLTPKKSPPQTVETDNLYAVTVGGDIAYLRQVFRGTTAINLETGDLYPISAIYGARDGGGWRRPVNYASGNRNGNPERWAADVVRVPSYPSAPKGGRAAVALAEGKIYFVEPFCVTCVETDK